MTIETQTTNRKALVRQISELLQQKAVYAGVLSSAYHIGAVMVGRSGAIHTNDSEALKTLKPFLIEQGFMEPEAESEAESEVQQDDSKEDPEHMSISVPAEDITVEALKNLTYMLYSKQCLMNRAVGNGLLVVPEALVTRLAEYTPDTPEAFSDLLGDFKALGELDGFDYRDGNVTLGFPFYQEQPERWTAYANLLNRIVKAACSATRVHPELKKPENEKYTMRAWLVRLGYGGADMKAERHLLLQELNGCTAFRTAEDAAQHKEKYAEIRRMAREQKKEDAE
jgi:hypothetical protein